MAATAVGFVLDDAAKTLLAASDIFKGPISAVVSSTTRPQWAALLERFKGEAGKVGVLWASGGAPPSSAVAEGVLDALLQAGLAACTCCHGFTAGAGPTLREALRKTADSLVQPSVELVQALAQGDARKIKTCIGKVWDACDNAVRTPLDNRAALFKAVAAVIVVLKDTLREVDELLAGDAAQRSAGGVSSSPGGTTNGGCADANGDAEGSGNGRRHSGSSEEGSSSGRTMEQEEAAEEDPARGAAGVSSSAAGTAADAGGAGSDDDDDEDMLDYDAGELNSVERGTVDASRQLLTASVACLTTLVRPLLQGPLLTGDRLEEWESALFHCRALQLCAEDLGAGLYPPQDAGEVTSAAQSLYDSCTLLIDEQGEADAATVGPQMEAVRHQLELGHQQLAVALAALDALEAEPA